MAFSPSTIEQAVKVFGSDHVLFGTDYPAAQSIEEQITIVQQLDLSPTEMEQIFGKNSNELLHLDVASAGL